MRCAYGPLPICGVVVSLRAVHSGSELRGITAGYRRLTDGNFWLRSGPDYYHMDDDRHEDMQRISM